MSFALLAASVLLSTGVGGIIGVIVHELTHAAAAAALRVPFWFGWEGGIKGKPYVSFQCETRLQSEVIRKAPLAVGAVAAGVLLVNFRATLIWMGMAGCVAGMLGASPEDLFVDAARQSAADAE